MTRFIALASAVLISAAAPYGRPAAPDITAPSVTVGRNLQTYTTVRLAQAAPENGLPVTLTSDDPSRLLLSKAPDQVGSASISLTVRPRSFESPEFWLQGLAPGGAVTYTVSAAGVGTAKGAVTVAPSAIVIVGPFKAPRLPTTPRGERARITVVSVVLDSSGKVAEEQQVAGGSQVEVTLGNSNPTAGKLGASKLTLAGGSSAAQTYFQPAAEGDATLAPVQPPGFTAPAEMATVVVAVAKPGLAITGDLFIGKDLQISAPLVLGEPAPPGGLKVTLTSADSSKLVLATREDQPGSASITITVPEGQYTEPYYVQALGDSGEVAYDAVAPGFRSRTATVGLTPSGIMITYQPYGAPEEGSVLQKTGTHHSKEIFISQSDAKAPAVRLIAWSAYIDRETGRAADITVQPLRPGITAKVVLTSSEPAVATVESPLIIKSGDNRAFGQLTPLGKGKTVISITPPAGFATPKNETSIAVTVSE